MYISFVLISWLYVSFVLISGCISRLCSSRCSKYALSLRTLAFLVIVGSAARIGRDLEDYSSNVVTWGTAGCKNAYPYQLVLIVLTSRNNAHMLPYMC